MTNQRITIDMIDLSILNNGSKTTLYFFSEIGMWAGNEKNNYFDCWQEEPCEDDD